MTVGRVTFGPPSTEVQRAIEASRAAADYTRKRLEAAVKMQAALEYLIEEPGHPEFTTSQATLDPIIKHWSHTGPQDHPWQRCPRCLIEAALSAWRQSA